MTFFNKIKGFFKKKEETEESDYVEVKEKIETVTETTPQVTPEVKVERKNVKSNEEIERELREFYKNRKERNQFR